MRFALVNGIGPIVYILIERAERELDSKLLVALFLVRKGFHVVLGQQWTLTLNKNCLPAGIFFFKGMNKIHTDNMGKVRQCGHAVVAMEEELLDIGIIDKIDIKNQTKESPAYKKYFMHGTSHHLGLDTHDYGLLDDPFEENMVFTVEPGIYLPEEGFGIRLEDDVVVQKNGDPINLMKDIPIEAEHIEELMNN